MAQVQSRKSNFYSQRQSVRDELSAPLHLESAGDLLIKHLARKQTNTCTSLQEQLQIVQNFEKGFKLNPDNRWGVTRLEEFKKQALDESNATASPERETILNLDELMRDTGLTRHELELGLCEKPNSTTSQLYMFAIGNKRRKAKNDTSLMSQHPINRLKEIEEECFGEKKNAKSQEMEPSGERENKTYGRRNKQRKRKRKTRRGANQKPEKPAAPEPELPKSPSLHMEKDPPMVTVPRPSLWDVKDMKKWAEPARIGCRPPTLYTIKNGKIIKLGEGSGSQDVT